ncbi:MAG: PAS domain S-box protein, partial [Sinobacteraceae bacterium]|nr:PAS domain S-box protein [Nevskiaceae bacterium]
IGVCLDIDGQKNTEAALRQAEERYELAVHAAHLPVWEYHVVTDTLLGNVYWNRALGYELSEGEARERSETWLSDVHPEDLRKYEQILRNAANEATGFFEFEGRVKHRGGTYRWILDRGRVVQRDGAGAPLKIVGISLDVDDRKRMESALRASEERFRSAFESASIGMALVAPDGHFMRVNEALCRIVGYSSDELLRVDFQSITHPDDLEKDLELAQQMLAGTRSYYEMEKRYFHKTGRVIWILLSVSLVRNEENQPQYFISQIQDITARKHAEAGLKESELRYRTTSELVPGFVFEASTTEGVFKPTWVSEGFERVYGCSLAEFQRLGLAHFYDAEARARRRAGCAAVQRGEEVRMDIRLRSLDGGVKWLRFSAKGIASSEGPGRVLGVAEDITEQMRLATALREATQQEQRRLGREIHDGLGQELTGLAYLAGSLARAAQGTQYAHDLATLESIANQSIKTCRDIARGISPLTESRGSLVQALHHLTESVATGGRMKIDFEAIENAELRLPWAARDQLYRIAQEAVTNALRHSGGDSMEVRVRVDPSLVRLEIGDNGRGLDRQRTLTTGLGIDSMRQRAAAIGATLSLGQSEAGGVAVVCDCPQPLASDDSGRYGSAHAA